MSGLVRSAGLERSRETPRALELLPGGLRCCWAAQTVAKTVHEARRRTIGWYRASASNRALRCNRPISRSKSVLVSVRTRVLHAFLSKLVLLAGNDQKTEIWDRLTTNAAFVAVRVVQLENSLRRQQQATSPRLCMRLLRNRTAWRRGVPVALDKVI